MSTPDVIAAADRALSSGDYERAVEGLKEVLDRMRGLTDPQQKKIAQVCRFELARAQYKLGNYSEGMTLLKEYLDDEPRPQERTAMRMIAQGFFEEQNWNEIEDVAARLLKYKDLEKDELLNINLLLGQARFQKGEYDKCIEPLRYAEANAKDQDIKGVCQIMVARALVEAGRWPELYGWIPYVYRTDRKYDITLNLTLMRAGQDRYEHGEFLNALLLYRMVLPREQLLDFAYKRISTITQRMSTGLTPMEVNDSKNQIRGLQDAIDTLKDMPPYEKEVTFRIGQIYAEVNRHWEAFVLFDHLYRTNRDNDIGEAALLQTVIELYAVYEFDRADERALTYLDDKPYGRYARTMLTVMMRNRLSHSDYSLVIGLRRYVEGLPSSDDLTEQRLLADQHNILAFAYLQSGDYKLAGEQFNVVLEMSRTKTGTESDTGEDLFGIDPERTLYFSALYYRGMSYMLQADYTSALADFKLYQKENPKGDLYADSMYREGVCLFGQDKIDESEKTFARFVNTFPSNSLVSEAYSLRGDIEASKVASAEDPLTLDRAQANYRKAIDTAESPLQASYPAFQAAKVFKMEYKWQEIIDLMNYYLYRWGDDADIAQSIYWMGQAQIELGQIQEEAIPAYIEAIDRFGNDPKQLGVDKIIIDLVRISEQYLSPEDKESLALTLKFKLTSIDPSHEVLKLRLQALQAMLEGEDVARATAAKLLNSLDDLKPVSPVVLSLMCDVAVDMGDVGQMMKLSKYFIDNFEDSELLWHGYRAKIVALLDKKDYWAALESIDAVQGLFGADVFMDWAQRMKADTLYALGKYEDAEAAYNMVFGIPQWRGPLFAEAMYGMGKCRLARNDLAMAHTFFQRTYLQFKAYDNGDWAAKAYLAAADCLNKMDRRQDAINTLKAMLNDNYTKNNPLADPVKKTLNSLGGI